MVDTDFQQVQAVEEGKAVPWLHIIVGLMQPLQGFPPEIYGVSSGVELVKNLLGDIADEVAIVVHPQHIAHDLLFAGLELPRHHLFDGL